jgi:hypothetical protein
VLFLCAERLDQSAPIINVIERGGDGANGGATQKNFAAMGFLSARSRLYRRAAMIAGLEEVEDAAAPFDVKHQHPLGEGQV